jgi:4-amino-4-deoxy-L-arabinose transferase-like glycosyltransferase
LTRETFASRASVFLAWPWVVALSIVALAIPAFDVGTRDPDSRLYAQIAARMSATPATEWIAPTWPPGWYMQGLFREHPAGIFFLPALLGGVGYPAEKAAYAANALYQVLTLVLFQRLAVVLVPPLEGRALGWILQLLPIAFTYRVRANHEPVVLLLLVAAVLSAERARSRVAWVAAMAASLCGIVLVKGVIGLVGLPVCALWLLARRGSSGSNRAAWLGLGASAFVIALTVWWYEALYMRVTGQSFLADYLGRQLGLARAPQSEALLAQKAYNLVWYLGRVLWFPFPWSLVLLAAMVGAWRSGRKRSSADGPLSPDARAGLVFTLALTTLYLGLFSLSDRRADRYIFPVYSVVGACGAVVALRLFSPLRRLAERLDRRPVVVQASLFILLFALHIAGGLLRLPTVKLWPPDS